MRQYNFNNNQETHIGSHNDAIKCVNYSNLLNAIITGSWDKTVKIWDPREKGCVATYDQCDRRVYSMDCRAEKIVVATQDRLVMIWDLRNMKQYMMRRESPFKFQTRAIRIFPNKCGYVMSSIDGRVAVDNFGAENKAELGTDKFSFKCHRDKNIYAVNAIGCHSGSTAFATGRSNCLINNATSNFMN